MSVSPPVRTPSILRINWTTSAPKTFSVARSDGRRSASLEIAESGDRLPSATFSVESAAELMEQAASSSAAPFCAFAELTVRLVKLLAMLTTLSLRITDDADARTRCSLLDRAVIPGKGRISRVQTSARSASSRARSPRAGASTSMRVFVVRSD